MPLLRRGKRGTSEVDKRHENEGVPPTFACALVFPNSYNPQLCDLCAANGWDWHPGPGPAYHTSSSVGLRVLTPSMTRHGDRYPTTSNGKWPLLKVDQSRALIRPRSPSFPHQRSQRKSLSDPLSPRRIPLTSSRRLFFLQVVLIWMKLHRQFLI